MNRGRNPTALAAERFYHPNKKQITGIAIVS